MFQPLLGATFALLMLLCPLRNVSAHDWYPEECCHGQDCAVVTVAEHLSGGRLRVTTVHGVGDVRADTSVRRSPDNKMHACLRQIGPDEEHLGWQLICLFVPGTS